MIYQYELEKRLFMTINININKGFSHKDDFN